MGALWVDQKGGALWVLYGLTRRVVPYGCPMGALWVPYGLTRRVVPYGLTRRVAPVATTLAVLWVDQKGGAHRYHSGCSMG